MGYSRPDRPDRRRWWLAALYALLTISALALATLLIGDLIAQIEEGTGGELHHLFVFDLAWPIFLVGSLATLAAGLGALVAWRLGPSPRLGRYAMWALGYVAVAIAILATGALEL
jgi:uncharacterized membrane protein